jgi:hypothetical protein
VRVTKGPGDVEHSIQPDQIKDAPNLMIAEYDRGAAFAIAVESMNVTFSKSSTMSGSDRT